jgi:crotonobetainyl-CoA:carnitine CoA-transferase CaiB-like acyl-CoA transferase
VTVADSSETVTAAWPAVSTRPGPLSGVRVLDLSRILAGPFATMLLADLGADVIKVEQPGTGDETRRWGPPFTDDGTATYFLAANRNKRSITADLGDPDAGVAVRRLAAAADVVVDNFLPGRLARFGLDHDAIAAHNPGVITCTITGFGSDGPHAGRPGFDFLIQAMGGMMAITGAEGGEPTKVGVAIADLASGLYASTAIGAALHRRAVTGEGARLEVALLDSLVSLLANQAMNWLAGGVAPDRLGNAHPNISPYESYRTADRPIAIAVGSDAQFRRLVHALDADDLADDPRFTSNADRVEHRAELRIVLERILGESCRDQWLERLSAASVPVGPINEVPEVFADPDLRARTVTEVGGVPQVRSPFRVDGAPMPLDRPPPALGKDTEAVLGSLGFDDERLAELRRRAAI